MPPLRLAILDPETMFTNMLSSLLISHGHCVLFTASDTNAMLNHLEALQPDILIVEIDTAPLNGYEFTKLVQTNWPMIRLVVVSKFCAPYAVAQLILNGISGYVTKKDTKEEFLDCLAAVLDDREYFSNTVAKNILEAVMSEPQVKGDMFKKEELEFIRNCCSEMPYKEMAEKMNTTRRILELYRLKIFTRLGLRSREGIILFALRNALVPIS